MVAQGSVGAKTVVCCWAGIDHGIPAAIAAVRTVKRNNRRRETRDKGRIAFRGQCFAWCLLFVKVPGERGAKVERRLGCRCCCCC